MELKEQLDNGHNPAHEKLAVKIERAKSEQTRKKTGTTIAELLDQYDRAKLSQLRTRRQANTFLREFREGFGNQKIGF